MDEAWTSGNGQRVTLVEIMDILRNCRYQSRVYVGTDSQMHGSICGFSTVIVLYSESDHAGGQYFYCIRKFPRNDFKQLAHRITTEVQYSVELACTISELIPDVNIEVHIDSSPTANETKTSKFSDSLVGYAIGMGFDAKIKPEAWAASNVADKHIK